jgi:hypothetical protein
MDGANVYETGGGQRVGCSVGGIAVGVHQQLVKPRRTQITAPPEF